MNCFERRKYLRSLLRKGSQMTPNKAVEPTCSGGLRFPQPPTQAAHRWRLGTPIHREAAHKEEEPMKARTFCAIVAVASSIAPFAAHTQSASHCPAKPIKLIISSSPGGPPDLVARLLGEALSKNFGQPVVVENRTGAIGTRGQRGQGQLISR